MEEIFLKKVATNNLKGFDIGLPLGKYTVVTGVSGSGKSSLVFDTLYGEAYRRYVESLSSFARQYLKALPKPDIAAVENLPPAIAVRQTRSGATSRSTVGTMTEINDLLRIIFTHTSEVVCPGCNQTIVKDNGESIAKACVDQFLDEQITITAPLYGWKKISAKELKSQLGTQGFSRIRSADGEIIKLEKATAATLKSAHVVIDRVRVSKDSYQRIAQSSDLALKVGRNHACISTDKENP